MEAVGRDEYLENKTGYQKSLHKEQKCWNEWMKCRTSVSEMLPDDLRTVNDGCTNLTRRTKLLQLKNQNKCLGVVSGDVIKCALPDDCSDKELMDYPGFDKVWEQSVQ